MSDKEHPQSTAQDGNTPAAEMQADTMQAAATQTDAMQADAAEAAESSGSAEAADATEAAAAVRLPLPGEILAAKRQERRMSIDEVSARIKLAPRQIAALETNDFAALPGMATTRGFIRSYARLLELDPEPLLAALTDEPNPAFAPLVIRRPLPSPAFSGRRYAPPTSHRRDARRLPALAAVMLVFVGTLAFIAYRQQWLPMPAVSLTMPGEAATAAGSDETVAAVEAPAVPAVPTAPASPSGDAPAVRKPEAAASASALQLAAREDAWIEIIAIDGERKLMSKLMKAGTTELIEITEPVVLVVGNAAGIEAVLRGQSLNLRAAARDNVAKLSLK
jgi:cytoskeleton protein RodZ